MRPIGQAFRRGLETRAERVQNGISGLAIENLYKNQLVRVITRERDQAAPKRGRSEMELVARDLRNLFDVGVVGSLSDGQLLDRFLACREEAIFEAIIDRHGPMVWGVCRRILRDHHDAEDAFQATFLVMARKAASIVPREKVGNWLYGVAYQTAMKARATRAKRHRREVPMLAVPEPGAGGAEQRDDRLGELDRELSRLPEKYRILIILCELEGTTLKAAAEQLGWPIGTVSGRLSRAKVLLARRLAKTGVAPSVATLAALFLQESASASVPTRLITLTSQAASLIGAGRAVAAGVVSDGVMSLFEGVMKTMSLSKIKVIVAVMLGVGLLAGGMRAASQIDPTQAKHEAGPTAGGIPAHDKEPIQVKQKVSAAAKPPDALPDGALAMQGVWTGVLAEVGGARAAPAENVPLGEARIHVKDDRLTLRGLMIHGTSVGFTNSVDTIFMLKTDATKTPRTIDLTLPATPDDIAPTTYLGIYRLDGDDLTICVSPPNKKRPSEFKTRAKTSQLLLKLKRAPGTEWQESPPKPLLDRQPGDNASAKPAIRTTTSPVPR
jgi:RNA polymerase sigma factor (sigma-70 family)